MWNIILSLIIGHGFLDPLTFKKSNDIFYYLTNIIFIVFLSKVFTEFVFLFFILFSMYHFGEDARFIFLPKKPLSRYFGCFLISSTIYNYTDWIILINNLNIDNITYIINLHVFLEFLFLISTLAILSLNNVKLFIFSLMWISLNIVFNPVQVLTIYLGFCHTPIAIYRFFKMYGKITLIAWFIFSYIVFIILEFKLITKTDIYPILGILISHMDCITIWQLYNKIEF